VELEDAVIESIYNWSASPSSEAFHKQNGKVSLTNFSSVVPII
jgi:hypothetical protein